MADNFERIIFQVEAETAKATAGLNELNKTLGVTDKQAKTLNDTIKAAKPNMDAVFASNAVKQNLDAISASMGNAKQQTVNFTGSVETLKAKAQELKTIIDNLTRAGRGNDESTKALIKEYELLSSSINNTTTKGATFAAQIRQNTNELFRLEQQGKANTKEYRDLLNATAKLKDEFSDLKTKVSNLGQDTRTLDGLIGSFQMLASGIQLTQGAMALFGGENEDLQKAFVKLQAIMAVTTALQQIQNNIQKESAAMLFLQNVRLKALAAAQAVYAFATGGATVATKAFRVALISTGVGALVVALGSLIAMMMDTEESMDELAQKTKEYEEATNKAFNALMKEYEAIEQVNKAKRGGIDETQREIMLAKAQGASKEELFKLQQKELQQQLSLLINEKNYLQQSQQTAEVKKKLLDLDREILFKKDELLAFELEAQRTANEEAAKLSKERLDKQREDYIKRLELLRDIAVLEAKMNDKSEMEILQLTKSWQQRIMDVKMSYKMATIEEKRKELISIDVLIKEAQQKERDRLKAAYEYNKGLEEKEDERKRADFKRKTELVTKYLGEVQTEQQRHEDAMFDITNESDEAATERLISNLQKQREIIIASGKATALDIQKIDNQIEEARAKQMKSIADKQKITFDDVVSSITQLAQESAKILSLFIEDYDKQIEKQQDNLSKAYDLAEKGNTTVVENEKKRMQELTRERKKYVNAQRALLMIETIANGVSAIAKSANLTPPLNIVAIAATLASLTAGIMKAKQIGESGQTGFKKGGYTGHKGVDDVAGVVHGQEYVMTASATKGNLQYFDAINTGKLSIAQLVKESAMYRALIPRERFAATSTTKPDATLSKLDSIEKSIKGQNRLTLKIDKNGISGIVSQYQSRQNRINKITRLG